MQASLSLWPTRNNFIELTGLEAIFAMYVMYFVVVSMNLYEGGKVLTPILLASNRQRSKEGIGPMGIKKNPWSGFLRTPHKVKNPT